MIKRVQLKENIPKDEYKVEKIINEKISSGKKYYFSWMGKI